MEGILQQTKTLPPQEAGVVYRQIVQESRWLRIRIGEKEEQWLDRLLYKTVTAWGHLLSSGSFSLQEKVECCVEILSGLPLTKDSIWKKMVEFITQLCTEPSHLDAVLREYQILLGSSILPQGVTKLLAACYRTQGWEAEYIRFRLQNLATSEDYEELACFWLSKGEIAQGTQIAETGIAQAMGNKDQLYTMLSTLYQQQGDWENQQRILRAAFADTPSLKRYTQLKALSQKCQNWSEIRKQVLHLLQTDAHLYSVAVEIALYERRFRDAVRLLQQGEFPPALVEQVARRIQRRTPKTALRLYRNLVETAIAARNRRGYRRAAGYAKRMRTLWLTQLKDRQAWEAYLLDIRQRYARYPALLEEWQRLFVDLSSS